MGRWDHSIALADVFHDETRTFIERRDIIVARLARLKKHFPEDWDLETLLDELSEVETEDYFNDVWDNLYDWCDDHRVWMATV